MTDPLIDGLRAELRLAHEELSQVKRRLFVARGEIVRLKRKYGELCADGQGDHEYDTRSIRVCKHCGQSEEIT